MTADHARIDSVATHDALINALNEATTALLNKLGHSHGLPPIVWTIEPEMSQTLRPAEGVRVPTPRLEIVGQVPADLDDDAVESILLRWSAAFDLVEVEERMPGLRAFSGPLGDENPWRTDRIRIWGITNRAMFYPGGEQQQSLCC